MEKLNGEFTEIVPSFTEFINENYPAGAANDPRAPWNQKEPESWAVTGVTYDDKEGDIIFDIDGHGYPSTVKVWAGENVIIDEIDPKLDLSQEETDANLAKLIADMNDDPNNIPAKIMDHIAGQLEDNYDENWAEDEAADQRFERTRDDI